MSFCAPGTLRQFAYVEDPNGNRVSYEYAGNTTSERILHVNGTLERRWTRPTYDINGLWSGYQGEGAKTVLPARAGAKFSFRLVPDQDPRKISRSLKKKLRAMCPKGITMELVEYHGAPGVVVPLDSPYVAAAERAKIELSSAQQTEVTNVLKDLAQNLQRRR